LEESCRAFNDIIEEGLAFYWGTSEWTGTEIATAIQICEKNNYVKPVNE